jgi:hypothetical protein
MTGMATVQLQAGAPALTAAAGLARDANALVGHRRLDRDRKTTDLG